MTVLNDWKRIKGTRRNEKTPGVKYAVTEHCKRAFDDDPLLSRPHSLFWLTRRRLKSPKIKPISIIAPIPRHSFARNILRPAGLRLHRRHERPLSHLRQLASRLLHFFENNNNNDDNDDDCDTVKGVGEKLTRRYACQPHDPKSACRQPIKKTNKKIRSGRLSLCLFEIKIFFHSTRLFSRTFDQFNEVKTSSLFLLSAARIDLTLRVAWQRGKTFGIKVHTNTVLNVQCVLFPVV